MRRILLVGVAVLVSVIAMAMPAAARLGIAPGGTTKVQDDAIQVKGGHGHGHGHGHMGEADADIIMAGAGAGAITTAGAAVAATGIIITTESGLCHLPRTNEIGPR